MARLCESTERDAVIQVLSAHDFAGISRALEAPMNEAMKAPEVTLGAGPYDRTSERRGRANGFKPKTVNRRLGKFQLQVLPTSGFEFYPKNPRTGRRPPVRNFEQRFCSASIADVVREFAACWAASAPMLLSAQPQAIPPAQHASGNTQTVLS